MKIRPICIALLVTAIISVSWWMRIGNQTDDSAFQGEPYSRTHFMKEIADASGLLGLRRGVAVAGGEHRVKIPGLASGPGTRGKEVQRMASDKVFGRITRFVVQSEQSWDMSSIAKYVIHVSHKDGIATSIEIHREGGTEFVAGMLQEELSKRFPKIDCRVAGANSEP